MKQEPSDRRAARTEKKRPPLRLIGVAVLGLLACIVVFQNTDSVETRLLFATIAMPRAVLLAITFLLGLVSGLLVAFLRRRKR